MVVVDGNGRTHDVRVLNALLKITARQRDEEHGAEPERGRGREPRAARRPGTDTISVVAMNAYFFKSVDRLAD